MKLKDILNEKIVIDVEVGDTNNASRFIRSGDMDVSASGQYHSQYQYEYTFVLEKEICIAAMLNKLLDLC